MSEEDINGVSGGPIASFDIEYGWRLEGICVEGSGSNISDRAGFVGRYQLIKQLKQFTEKINNRLNDAS